MIVIAETIRATIRANINIVAVGKKCWEKGLIFIWILGQVDEWEGERAYINIISFCKDCEYLADSLLRTNPFA